MDNRYNPLSNLPQPHPQSLTKHSAGLCYPCYCRLKSELWTRRYMDVHIRYNRVRLAEPDRGVAQSNIDYPVTLPICGYPSHPVGQQVSRASSTVPSREGESWE
ncbi:hypothetical protein FPOAC1_000733 [Fusarium poae]|uniref:hypothetical protein n=1 Tax=Fusarium poae TaxID=36050 RepID=UPI001CEAA250|nr:hypothetical protein FPOAC1_000733 [Fusarium poae]KAG8674761.1 hypothetical protein FPOAC1_000733 [Fusarium poae]